MPYCPNCNSEYEDWVQFCADCDVPLTPTRTVAGGIEAVRSMFRPLGALQQERAAQINSVDTTSEDTTTNSALSTQHSALPFSGRYAGRNRRLKGRQPPPFVPTAAQLDVPPLPRDAVLPMNINFNIHDDATVDPPGSRPRGSYDRSGDAWVMLTTAPNEIMATLLRSQLADGGIPALVKLGTAVDNGEFINNAWVMRSVWVQAREVERAREVLNFYHGDGPLAAAEEDEDDEEYEDEEDERGGRASRWREMERPPKYELPWLPTEHYEDRDMVAANASVDEQGRTRRDAQNRSPLQRPWVRWMSFILLLAWVLPYLIELLGHIGNSLGGIFGGR